MGKKYVTSLFLILSLPIAAAVSAQASSNAADDEALYSEGVAMYRAASLDDARGVFELLLEKYPESRKADDAFYYLGRIHSRMGRTPDAESAYRKVLDAENSNRKTEAAFELGRIVSRRRDYPAVVALLEPFRKISRLDIEDANLLLLLGRTRYNLGILAKKEGNSEESRLQLEGAAADFGVVADAFVSEKSGAEALSRLGRTQAKLLELSRTPEEKTKHRDAAVRSLKEAIQKKSGDDDEVLRDLLEKVQGRRGRETKASVTAAGGADVLDLGPALRVEAKARTRIPISDLQRFELEGRFEHDSLSSKTFNFADAEDGLQDKRLYQRIDRGAVRAVWRAGERDALLSRLSFTADALLAENDTDNSWGVGLSEKISSAFASDWRASLDASASLSVFPNYLSSGRKLDSVSFRGTPQIEWRPADPLHVSLAYSYTLKQYLDARYDTASDSKQYHTHAGELNLKAKAGEWRPSLGYTFTYNKTFDYDIWLTSPTPDVFVEDYFDYTSHTFDTGLAFERGPLKVKAEGSLTMRDFANYPARDETGELTGDMRRDLKIAASLNAAYSVWSSGASVVSLFLEAELEKADSNMVYETSFDTEYTSLTLFAGVVMEF